jgi:3-phosphoshikimate 1-carboxyvinyltransferase
MTYPAELEIIPLTAPPTVTVSVPGSKSITNRALVLAAFTEDGCQVTNRLDSEDTEVMTDSLIRLGFKASIDTYGTMTLGRGTRSKYEPRGEWIPNTSADLFVGNSGTTIRFLTAILALGEGTYRLDGISRMRERPIEDLLDALRQLGVDAASELGNGCPPVVIRANGLRAGRVRVRAGTSSQFLSGLLLALPFARGTASVIDIDGPVVSEPYIELTIAMLQAFGLSVKADGPRRLIVPAGQSASLNHYQVEPDASSASYYYAASAICGGNVGVQSLTIRSIQGDVRFIDVLEEMGCSVCRGEDCVAVTGRPLRGIDVDMNDISDTVMTLAAVACFAEGPTTIRNVAHIRHKETDRISAMATELRKLGAEVEEYPDGLKITPRPLKGCAVETYYDHRMAMSLALIGLKVPGVIIKNPGCVAKTYPGFWQDFEKLRG